MQNDINDLEWAHPIVREWFYSFAGAPTQPQREGWPPILAGHSTLISAPTGSGKTLAAFLTCIDRLIRQALAGELIERTEVLYISPLKALSNDIQKNLAAPLAQMAALAQAKGINMPEIRVALRTGDTLNRDRQAMLKHPPHILITTPESFYILLTAEKSRKMLMSVNTVIIDEIHAVANDKRGAHLALSLERLQALTFAPPVRIGLSATQKPIEKMAQFLVGNNQVSPVIVNIGHKRKLDLAIEIPKRELGPITSNEIWDEIYDSLAELAQQNRSTLIFVNTRRLAERIAHRLAERLGEDQVAAHHGSLSRKLRLSVEKKLKNGELKALVATASLELGIDIGVIDLVCQIGSPRAISIALQRIGRAGHWLGAIPKGRIFATTLNELLECTALVHAISKGDLDQLRFPIQPMDILAQQIVATCATGDWLEDDLFNLVKKAYPYANLSRESFDAILIMLSEGIAGNRGRYGAYLFRDQINGIVRARRGSRLTAITSGGAIPENGLFTVIAEPEGVMVGTLDEDFAIESNRGDIILLGTASWKIRRVESSGRVIVEDAHGAPPNVPFWRGEAPARTDELSMEVAELRQKLSDSTNNESDKNQMINYLQADCGLNLSASHQLIDYILRGKAILGAVPTQKRLIAERFFDEAGGMQLIIHSPFGARINKAWGLALRKRFCRSFNFELQAAATDDGLSIALAEQHSFPLADVFHFLHPATLREVLIQAVLQSPLFTTRWRWDAMRALALVRFRYGKKTPPHILRMLADDLLASVFPDAAACQDNLGGKDIELPDHPLINEVIKDVLTEALDLEGLRMVLEQMADGRIQYLAVDTPTPSCFAHEILNANPFAFLDDAPLEERRAKAVEMRRLLPDKVLQSMGRLDPEVIAQVQEQAWPDVRNADELHDALQTLIAWPEQENFRGFFTELCAGKRAGHSLINGKIFWWAAEKFSEFAMVYCQDDQQGQCDYGPALVNMIRGWLFHSGPITATELAQILWLKLFDVEQALLKLETTGLILRGHFRELPEKTIEWCERRLLARIHRLTLGQLRKEIEPVSPSQFMHWLHQWQHLAPGSQLRGEQGLLEVIRQLQGYEASAKAWESEIFAKRVADYNGQMLDNLCLKGVIGWGRLASPLAEDGARRIRPSSIAPITFFIREDTHWFPDTTWTLRPENLTGLSALAKKIQHFLQQKGACFFADIVRGCNHLKSEIETGLWELVAAGIVTADGFDNLRALLNPLRRCGKQGHRARVHHSAGRWSLLPAVENFEEDQHLEALCWILLKRYGVVFRDLLVKKPHLPNWRELLRFYRRLEERGEIRGGRFVTGFLGEQFALPYAIDSLRSIKKKELLEYNLNLASADPLAHISLTVISKTQAQLPL